MEQWEYERLLLTELEKSKAKEEQLLIILKNIQAELEGITRELRSMRRSL